MLVGDDETSVENYLSGEPGSVSDYQRINLRTLAVDRMVRP